jgi:hypothetical protein
MRRLQRFLVEDSQYVREMVHMRSPVDLPDFCLQGPERHVHGHSICRAATAAMLREQDSSLTYGKLRSLITDHVTPNPALAGKTVTGGQLDVAACLAAVH